MAFRISDLGFRIWSRRRAHLFNPRAVRQGAEKESYMTSAERVAEYGTVPTESTPPPVVKPPAAWPDRGVVQVPLVVLVRVACMGGGGGGRGVKKKRENGRGAAAGCAEAQAHDNRVQRMTRMTHECLAGRTAWLWRGKKEHAATCACTTADPTPRERQGSW